MQFKSHVNKFYPTIKFTMDFLSEQVTFPRHLLQVKNNRLSKQLMQQHSLQSDTQN